MMCQHQIALCKIHDCATCAFQGDEARCPYAHNESADECSPTFAQAIMIYHLSGITAHSKQVERIIERDITRVGLSLDSKCAEMTRAKFKTLIALLTAPLADGTKLRGDTIKSHLAAFGSLANELLEDRYNDEGFDLPMFSIPKFTAEKTPVQEVSDRTIRLVEIEMEKWLASGKSGDADAYKLCFFALYCGMRAGDICQARWNIIQRTTAGVMIDYTPHKSITALNPKGRRVSFMMPNKTYVKIEPLIGDAEDFIITRHTNRTPKRGRKNGDFEGRHVYLRDKVNKMLSACGIGNEYKGQKKTHALRKYFETDRVFMVGNKQAADECGHSVEIQKRNYLGTLAGKVL